MATTSVPKPTQRVLGVSGALAVPACLIGIANSVTPGAHAINRSNFNPICYACQLHRPSIQITYYDPDNASLGITGLNFTPGGAVHIEVFDTTPNPTPTPGYDPSTMFTIGQADISATIPLHIPVGFGQYVNVPGGTITASVALTPSVGGSQDLCPVTAVQVVATDEATGLQASTTLPENVC